MSVQITLVRPDGLHILTTATLPQMAGDEMLLEYADGLVPAALESIRLADDSYTLANALQQAEPHMKPLLIALLVLDAEVRAVIEDKSAVIPLPGFLTYRSSLSPDKISLSTLRLPPVNPDGHYLLSVDDRGSFYFAIRLDLHPRLKVAGHVRIAVSSTGRLPQRLQETEHRLDRQVLAARLIEAAVAAGSEELSSPLTGLEQAKLVEALAGLLDDV